MLWDPVLRQKRFSILTGYAKGIQDLALTPDGQTVLSAEIAQDDRAGIHVWDGRSGKKRAVWQLPGSWPHYLAVSPDGGSAATTWFPGGLVLRDLAADQFGARTGVSPEGGCLAFAPDGLTLAVGGKADGRIVLWDTVSAQPRTLLRGHRKAPVCLAFTQDGKTLASGDGEGVIKLWHVPTGQELLTLQGCNAGLLSLAFSPDGRMLAASGCSDHGLTAEVWVWLTADSLRALPP